MFVGKQKCRSKGWLIITNSLRESVALKNDLCSEKVCLEVEQLFHFTYESTSEAVVIIAIGYVNFLPGNHLMAKFMAFRKVNPRGTSYPWYVDGLLAQVSDASDFIPGSIENRPCRCREGCKEFIFKAFSISNVHYTDGSDQLIHRCRQDIRHPRLLKQTFGDFTNIRL